MVMKSDMSNEEMDEVSFPWGREDDPENVVTLTQSDDLEGSVSARRK